MFQPDNGCKTCGLYRTCLTPKMSVEVVVNGEVAEDQTSHVDIMFVGDSPGSTEDKHGRPMMGRAGKFFRDFISKFKDNRIAITQAVACRTSQPAKWGGLEDRAPEDPEINACRRFVLDDIMKLKPKVVVMLGGPALKSVWENGPKTVKAAKVQPAFINGRWFLTTYHPSMHFRAKQDLTIDYKSLGRLINKMLEGTYQQEIPDIRDVSSSTDMKSVLKQVINSNILFFDTEYNTWDYGPEYPYMQTIYQKGRDIICVGIGTSQKEPVWVLRKEQFRTLLPYIRDKKIKLVAFNMIADAVPVDWAYEYEQVWDHNMDDPFLAQLSMDCGREGLSLENMAMVYRHVSSWKPAVHQWIHEENKRRQKDKKNVSFVPATLADLPWKMMMDYNGRDVFHLMGVYEETMKLSIPSCYKDRYLRFMKFLGKVSRRGLPANAERARTVMMAYEHKIKFLVDSLQKAPEVRSVVDKYGKERFNVRSPRECTELLSLLEIETGMTESGKYAKFDKGVRTHLAARHSLIRRIHVIRTYLDMVSKFLRSLPHHVAKDGCIHGTYTLGRGESTFPVGSDPQGGTTTGRISMRDPALHNIKKDDMLRSCFEAPPGYVLIELDYSAAEVRWLAEIAGVKNLIQWFNENKDPYLMLMSYVDKVSYEEAYASYLDPKTIKQVKARRARFKQAFLAWQYGSGMDNFAFIIGSDHYTAEMIYSLFNDLFPEIRSYQARLINRVKSGKMLTTRWGLQRRFACDTSHDENQIKNFETQSTSSDTTVHIGEYVENNVDHDLFAVVNVVHDALYGLTPIGRVDEAIAVVGGLMRNPPNLPFSISVKLEVEAKVGRNLGMMDEYDMVTRTIKSKKAA